MSSASGGPGGASGSGSSSSGSSPGANRAANVAMLSDAVKSVSDAFTQTFVGAGQAVAGTTTSIVAGTQSVVGDVAGTITSAVSTVAQGVSALTASLGPVGAVIGGVVSAVSSVTSAVIGVASAVTSTVLSIGSAVLSTATSLVSAAVSIVGSVISTCASFISTIAGLFAGASAALGAFGAVVSGVVGVFAGVANIIGSVVSALSSVVTGIVSALTSVVSAITAAFKSVSESLGSLMGIAGQALGGFINAVQSCVDSLLSFAQNVTSISNYTGMSTSQASGLVTDMQVLGVSPKETSQFFGSLNNRPEIYNARSKAMGLAPVGDVVAQATKFQEIKQSQGLPVAMSRLNAQAGGKAPEFLVRLANTSPQKIRDNLNFGRQTQAQLGVGDSQIKTASEDLPLLMSRVSTFVDTLKVRFAADLLPSLTAGFNMVANFLKNNAGTISDMMKTATRAIFVDGPDIAAKAALTVLDWASALSTAFFSIVDAGISLLETFGSRNGVIFNVLMTVARTIDMTLTIISRLRGIKGPKQTAAQDAVKNMADKAKGVDTDGQHKWVAARRKESESFINARKANVKDAEKAAGTKDERDWTMRQEELNVHKEHLQVSRQQLDIAKSERDKGGGGGTSGQVIARLGAYLAQDAYRLTSR